MGIKHLKKLDKRFYQGSDVAEISRDILGKALCTNFDGQFTSGIIVETEAYCGRNDKACHANNQRRTNRTEIMYGPGGTAYVYLCYGIHHLFNIVTNVEGMADAILVRALQPLEGTDIMLQRRKMDKVERRLTSGPGVLTQALGITTKHYGEPLTGDKIWIADVGIVPGNKGIIATKRIGVGYAGEDAEKPWRFILRGNDWVSKG